MKDCCVESRKTGGKFCSTCGANIEDMDFVINISILGDGGIGKSMITCQYVKNTFDEGWDPTIQDSYNRRDLIQGKVVLVKLIDTSGQEEFKTLLPDVVRSSEGIVIAYDVTNRKSYQHATETLLDMIQKIKGEEKWTGILVGNKVDLENERLVPKKDAQDFAKQHNLFFLESSAKKRQNIDEIFQTIIQSHFKLDIENTSRSKPTINKKKGLFSSISEEDSDLIASIKK